ncbi:hypothetical protein AMECASPLE_014427 [Ameca splendens]|uniref:Uncharacterized protein n=1 Tax=Ameca splendens TaxID=208324 RepID=A0ABV0XQH0_9TELE
MQSSCHLGQQCVLTVKSQELAQGSVAMLQGKTGRLLSCGPEGCWDGKPRPRGEINFWRRTMFKNGPQWTVYSMLIEHFSLQEKQTQTEKTPLCCINTSFCLLHHIKNKFALLDIKICIKMIVLY